MAVRVPAGFLSFLPKKRLIFDSFTSMYGAGFSFDLDGLKCGTGATRAAIDDRSTAEAGNNSTLKLKL